MTCAPDSGDSWTGYAQDAVFGHACGNAYGSTFWQYLFPGMVGCSLQSSGPGFSLPAGSYSATIAYEGYSASASMPVDLQLLVMEGSTQLAVGSQIQLPTNEVISSTTVNFSVGDSCGAGINLLFLVSEPTFTGQGTGGFAWMGKETITKL